jgi:acetyltransferase-like isoleucine patch superfamily enzyme
MKILHRILNKLFSIYLNQFQGIKISSSSFIDYRCEIEKKRDITIGEFTIFYKNSTIYKGEKSFLRVGNHSHIAPYGYFLMGNHNITIGNSVAIGKNCSFFCVTNSIPHEVDVLYKDSYIKGDITIGDNVFIGTNCVVLPKTIIEDDVVVAANSTIKGRLRQGYLYGGNPVKKIKKVKDV